MDLINPASYRFLEKTCHHSMRLTFYQLKMVSAEGFICSPDLLEKQTQIEDAISRNPKIVQKGNENRPKNNTVK
jgi:hypothetical protein